MFSVKVVLVLCVFALAAVACSPATPSVSTTTTSSTPTPTAPYTLNGRVVQALTANGVAAASITLTSPSSVVSTTTTDTTGAFSFSGLGESGTYTIDATAAGYVPTETTMAIPVTSTFTINITPAKP
jgi:carboxypeptidase family protein